MISYVRVRSLVLGKKIIYSGGGYFRIFPGNRIQKWFGDDHYVMTYFHPRDFDTEQPVIPNLSPIRRFKSYVGIKGAKKKLVNLLAEYKFIDLHTAVEKVDWDLVPRVNLQTGTSL